MKKIYTYILMLLSLSFSLQAHACSGTLDITFNCTGLQPGTAKTYFKGLPTIEAVATQPDGKVVVAGRLDSYILLMRYTIDGSLDKTFNSTGIVLTAVKSNNTAIAIAIQKNGSIVVAGILDYSLGVLRYNADGSLDTTFNEEIPILPTAIVVQKDEKIVIAGRPLMEGNISCAVVRYNADGSLDKTFNPDGSKPGIVISPVGTVSAFAHSIAQQKDGKLVVSGTADDKLTILRYNRNGTLDTTFNGTGIVKSDLNAYNTTVAMQTDGKIVAAVTAFERPTPDTMNQKFAVVRYNNDGSIDTTFNKNGTSPGIVFSQFKDSAVTKSLMLQKNGKIVVMGTMGDAQNQSVLVCYNPDGTVDTTFNGKGTQPGVATVFMDGAVGASAVINHYGKIVVAGNTYDTDADFVIVARYHADPVV